MSRAMQLRQEALESMLRAAPVVAVVVIEKLADAVPLARALVAGGIPAIEITLRTPVALDAIRSCRRRSRRRHCRRRHRA